MASYRVFGSENSPYSVKVRAYFRYKGIPHEWIVRNGATAEEFNKFAKLPIVPTVATPEGAGLQDSTPILEAMEAKFPEPSIHPAEAELRFLSELLEEFGDEWGNKWMFHLRWAREADQLHVSRRLASELMPAGQPEDATRQFADAIRARMTGRGFAVGSNERTAAYIERNFAEALALLEAHLARRPFLFGARPALADFGLGSQVYEAMIDPTGGELVGRCPRVAAWCERMLRPEAEGAFEPWESLQPTMEPLLRHVSLFLRWSSANARAVAAGAEEMEVDLDGFAWWQTVGSPQRYHEKSLRELRRKYQLVAGNTRLNGILERCGCLRDLAAGGAAGGAAGAAVAKL